MWIPFEFLVGNWQGIGNGQPGTGQYERSYEFILNGKFLHVRNKSTYPHNEQNPTGEIHEDWGFISRDKVRNIFVYRQFHIEGFVNQYRLDYLAPDLHSFVFVSESIENFPAGWRAKETYTVLTPDEFVETFELAEPEKDYEVYTRCQLRRISKKNR
jgi:hypothetical protein